MQSLPWVDDRPGAHVARAALFMLLGQVEAGVGCPLSMTFAAVPALRAQPDLAAEWIPRLTSGEALCGMAMTERQGGSDVRANETTARPDGDVWLLDGHKWFCSAPMSDAFLVLAQAPAGLSCFLLERRAARLPDRAAEGQARQPLERLGRDRARRRRRPRLVGEEGRGVRTIIEMVNHTRLDCVLGSAALMRRAVAEATHHAAHRSAFGRLLAEQPLMQNVLADLCVESRGGDRDRAAARASLRRGATGRSAGWRRRSRSSGSASGRRRSSRRRSSASAATATSRSRSCRGSSARARSTRSGRAPAT